jgi:hypothetical protein
MAAREQPGPHSAGDANDHAATQPEPEHRTEHYRESEREGAHQVRLAAPRLRRPQQYQLL